MLSSQLIGPKFGLCVCLAVGLGTGLLFGLPDSSGEIVGQQACAKLIGQLLDCLVEACDLQLALHEPPQPKSLGHSGNAVGPSELAPPGELLEDMDYLEPEEDGQSLPDEPVGKLASTSGCWREAALWLRGQLLLVRVEPGALAGALQEFGHLGRHFATLCPDEPEQAVGARDFTRETLGVMGQLALEAAGGSKRQGRTRAWRRSSEFQPSRLEMDAEALGGERCEARQFYAQQQQRALPSLAPDTCPSSLVSDHFGQSGEVSAIETIERHYAHLAQIITSFQLLSGTRASDDHLVASDSEPSKGEGQ